MARFDPGDSALDRTAQAIIAIDFTGIFTRRCCIALSAAAAHARDREGATDG